MEMIVTIINSCRYTGNDRHDDKRMDNRVCKILVCCSLSQQCASDHKEYLFARTDEPKYKGEGQHHLPLLLGECNRIVGGAAMPLNTINLLCPNR